MADRSPKAHRLATKKDRQERARTRRLRRFAPGLDPWHLDLLRQSLVLSYYSVPARELWVGGTGV